MPLPKITKLLFVIPPDRWHLSRYQIELAICSEGLQPSVIRWGRIRCSVSYWAICHITVSMAAQLHRVRCHVYVCASNELWQKLKLWYFQFCQIKEIIFYLSFDYAKNQESYHSKILCWKILFWRQIFPAALIWFLGFANFTLLPHQPQWLSTKWLKTTYLK